MKFNDIAAVAKKSKVAVIVDKEEEQWLSVYGAVYKLIEMPKLSEETILPVLGVIGKEKDKWFVGREKEESNTLNESTIGEREARADEAGMEIIFDERILMPVYTNDGMMWIDKAYLKPITNTKSQYINFHVREMENGRRALAVKDGLFLIAVIGEIRIKDDKLTNQMRELLVRVEMEAEREEAEARRRGEEILKEHNVCEYCGAILDWGERCDCQDDTNKEEK